MMIDKDQGGIQFGFLTTAEKRQIPLTTREDRIKELKGCFSRIWGDVFHCDGAVLTRECGIVQDTFYRLTKRSEGRNIKRHHVLRLAIGARLSEKEAREMLDMLGEPLDEEHNRLDYIFLCNLRHGSGIDELERDLAEFGLELR